MAVVSEAVRAKVAERAGFVCEYCRYPQRYAPERFAIDHVVPRAARGASALANLALSCRGCNEAKSSATRARDPVTQEEVSLFNPRRDRWEDHFGWSADFTQMIGRTPVGRATISRLDVNREGCVNEREALRELGRHPPLP